MNAQPESLETLQAEYADMETQPKNEDLLRRSVRLNHRLLASVTTSDGPEFQMASELYDQIQAFTQQIVDAMTQSRLAHRTVRRQAIRDENARRANTPYANAHGNRSSSYRHVRDEARRNFLTA